MREAHAVFTNRPHFDFVTCVTHLFLSSEEGGGLHMGCLNRLVEGKGVAMYQN